VDDQVGGSFGGGFARVWWAGRGEECVGARAGGWSCAEGHEAARARACDAASDTTQGGACSAEPEAGAVCGGEGSRRVEVMGWLRPGRGWHDLYMMKLMTCIWVGLLG
jgi:hypothetical protein